MSYGRLDGTGVTHLMFSLILSHAFLRWYLPGHGCTEFKGTCIKRCGICDQTLGIGKQRHTNAIGHFWSGAWKPQRAGIGKDEGFRDRGRGIETEVRVF